MFKMTDEQLKEITKLIKKAGETILSASEAPLKDSDITQKSGDSNYYTAYDVEVQHLLVNGLHEIFPGAAFLAEEEDRQLCYADFGLLFIIDPIDGTTNFIHDMRCSAVSVGLLYDGKPCAGFVYLPYTGEFFRAETGGGAYLNDKRIFASQRELSDALVCFGTSPYKKHELAEESFDMAKKIYMRSSDIRRSGSAAADLCYLACGRTDVFFEKILSPWDYAAGYVIATQANAVMTDFKGNPVSFKEPSEVLCCANQKIKRELMNLLKN